MAVRLSLQDWLAAYQLVGEVTAHQGYDGYLVWCNAAWRKKVFGL